MMRPGVTYPSLGAAWAILGAMVLVGCENAISPLSDDAGGLFAVHGFLTMQDETQFLRVERLRPSILSPETDASSATVRTVHVASGLVTEWETAENQPDGVSGTIFTAGFSPMMGDYRLEIFDAEQSDVPMLTAVTTVPDVPPVLVGSADFNPNGITLPLVLPGVLSQPETLSMVYTIRTPGSVDLQDVEVNYGKAGSAVQTGWRFTVFLKTDRQWLLRVLGVDDPAESVGLSRVRVRATILSHEWFRPLPSNIQGGHGFFGSVAAVELEWIPESVVADEAGFRIMP